jgi:oxidase EvaA
VNQPEVGILGIIVKEFGGVLHCLLSAKMEPGNVNTLQLSPTVQATRSNYTRAHQGGATAYLEHFVGRTRSRVLVDVLQSEQGSWFHRKCNRNMVVEVFDDIPVGPDHCWLTLGQVLELMHEDNIVNMDARTVLACMPFDAPAGNAPADPWSGALHRSLAGDHSLHSQADLLSWFTEAKTRYFLHADRVPLADTKGWHRTATEIAHDDDKYFKVIAASVAASNREVARWSQPLIEPLEHGLVALLVKRIHGVLHALIHVRVEAGYLDTLELAPTVQCSVGNYDDIPAVDRPPFLADVLAARPDQIRYSALLSEEGGRFYHAQNRYQIIEVDAGFPTPEGPDFRWMTLAQLRELLQHSHYLNVQMRSLVTSLHALWSGRS